MNKIQLALKKFPKAKKIAVENFTYGREGRGMSMEDSMNLELDARAYGWNAQTVQAIRYVMR